jgi:Neuraminidase (sialidase)
MRQSLLYVCAILLLALPASAAEPGGAARIVSAADAGGYAAFPDLCRTKAGELLCVFYSGSGHVTMPGGTWPKGGRIMAARSADDGKTWGKPVIAVDTPEDDRDPSVVRLKDGTLLMNWFTLVPNNAATKGGPRWSGLRLLMARSTDSGVTWTDPRPVMPDAKLTFAVSSPARILPDGSLILGLYHAAGGKALGATVKSADGGKTWTDLAFIGEKSGVKLDAETDVVALKDGRLLAALRSSGDLYTAESADLGKTWGPVKSLGFKAHCPYFLRHSGGTILLATRYFANAGGSETAAHWSADDGKTWNGPVTIDSVGGAYPSMVELPGGEVYCVYYEEGKGSGIRGQRLRVTPQGVEVVPPTGR